MKRSDQKYNENEIGLYGISRGDPGFTFVIEISIDWNDVAEEQRKQLNSYRFPGNSLAGPSRLGTTILSIECEQRGWYKASDESSDYLQTIRQDWPISGIHLCRSDILNFEYAPDVNLTRLHLEARPKDTRYGTAEVDASTLIIEIDVEWNDLSSNEKNRLKASGDPNFGVSRHVEKSPAYSGERDR